MDPVHDKGVHGPGPWKGVHGPGPYFDGPGPWTRSTEGVHGLGVHVLYFPGILLVFCVIDNFLKPTQN